MKIPSFAPLLLLVFLVQSCLNETPPPADYPDEVFINGKIYTVNEAQPWAEAICIKSKLITFVGSTEEVQARVGEHTRVTDLNGQMVLPGFVSGHDHLIASNWARTGVNLFEAQNKEDYLRIIKEYAEANPEEEFIIGYGWEPVKYGGIPTAKDLDAVVPDRPAMIFDYTIHDMWFNTKGLEAGKVSTETPDPQPGFSYWRRDADGEIEGVAIEMAWLNAFLESGAWKPEVLIAKSQKILYQKAAESGLTAVINQGLLTPQIEKLDEYLKDVQTSFELLDSLDQAGTLQLRTFQQTFYKNPNLPVDNVIQAALKLRRQYNNDRVRMSGIKIDVEGNWNTQASLMPEPYVYGDTGNAEVPVEQIKEMILKANQAGLDVSVHLDETATVRTTIDAIEESRKAGNKGLRNSLQHYRWVAPEDHQRAIAMDLPIQVTPIFSTDWKETDKPVLNTLEADRAKEQYTLYPDAFRQGLKVSLSADIPSSPVDFIGPLFNIEAAITLQDPTNPDSKPFPEGREGITLEQAIKGVTIYPAWQARMETKIGSLEAGKYADLVILEQNLFEIDPHEIADVKIVATMMDGRYTFQAP